MHFWLFKFNLKFNWILGKKKTYKDEKRQSGKERHRKKGI